MNVRCDFCQKQMKCTEKKQAAEHTKSTWVCGTCTNRVVVTRKGMRTEDVSENRENENGDE